MRGLALVVAAAAGLLASGCGSSKHASGPVCPAAWKQGWQKLADRIKAPVYCPSWLPDPLTGDTKGPYRNGVSVDPDRSYLVSFVFVRPPELVQFNFRGYPGRTSIPMCREGSRMIPCFSHPIGHRRANGVAATVYAIAQDADTNHIAYVWKDRGTLYTISELVAEPYPRKQVLGNLDRALKGLARVKPV